jgi:hypothetical protein
LHGEAFGVASFDSLSVLLTLTAPPLLLLLLPPPPPPPPPLVLLLLCDGDDVSLLTLKCEPYDDLREVGAEADIRG